MLPPFSSATPALAAPSGGLGSIEVLARSFASRATSLRLILLSMTVLSTSVVISALTTQDRMWWTQAFSRLGVFGDFSSLAFNGGLIVAGTASSAFAVRLWLDLFRLRARGVRRRAAVVIPALCVFASVGIMMVGLVPENTIKPLHDAAAMMMTAAFAGLMSTAPRMLRVVFARIRTFTIVCAVVFVAFVGLLVAEVVTLALMELVMFGLFFAWLATLSHTVHAEVVAPAPAAAAVVAAEPRVAVVEHRPSVLVAHVAPRRRPAIVSRPTVDARATGRPAVRRAPSRAPGLSASAARWSRERSGGTRVSRRR